MLGLLAADLRRPSDDEQRTLWEENVETEEGESGCGDSTLDPTRIYRSLTDEGNFGSDVIIRVADMRKKEISSADDQTLRSFLLSREAVSAWIVARSRRFALAVGRYSPTISNNLSRTV